MIRDNLKLLFVVDGRSPIALNWIRYFVDSGHDVHLASMYSCVPEMKLASLTIIPVAFSGVVNASKQSEGNRWDKFKGKVLRTIATPSVRTWLRQRIVPNSLPKAAQTLQSLISDLQPDIVHAMRIPYEGMLSAMAIRQIDESVGISPPISRPPLLVSIWGNDFTLHAPATQRMTHLSRFTMEYSDALHTDCHRDQRMAQTWGFNPAKPSVVLPGAGGIQLDVFFPQHTPSLSPGEGNTIINPRGLRAYVRNDSFFGAIPLVLERHPQTRFVCPSMAGQPEAQRWVDSLGIGQAVELLPVLSRTKMADLFNKSQIVVSPSTHDGTPNTILEAMACGCFPVVGDIESLREWITPGVNGLLVDPTDPVELAEAICEGLQNLELRKRSQKVNIQLIAERADYARVMPESEAFYRELVRLRQTA